MKGLSELLKKPVTSHRQLNHNAFLNQVCYDDFFIFPSLRYISACNLLRLSLYRIVIVSTGFLNRLQFANLLRPSLCFPRRYASQPSVLLQQSRRGSGILPLFASSLERVDASYNIQMRRFQMSLTENSFTLPFTQTQHEAGVQISMAIKR